MSCFLQILRIRQWKTNEFFTKLKKKIINTCRWHIKEWTILRHASADVGAFVVIFWKPSTSSQDLGSNLSMVVIEKGTKSAKRFQKKILLWNLLSSHTIISFWNLHLVNIKTDDWSVAWRKNKNKTKKTMYHTLTDFLLLVSWIIFLASIHFSFHSQLC